MTSPSNSITKTVDKSTPAVPSGKTNLATRDLLQSEYVLRRFHDVLGNRAQGFITSVLSIVSNNELLAEADPKSIINAAMIAATLDLPINQNLGFAYIIPYKDKKTGKTLAQFQLGYKAFIQLSQRSGQFSTINVSDVREGEIASIDRLTGEIQFTWSNGDRDNLPIIGYVAYMRLINGFSKSLYMTVQQLKNHGLRYSQTAKRGYGLWEDNFDAMASKTLIKLLLSKYAPLTTQMQTAQLADQAVITEEDKYEYVDNKPITPEDAAAEKERERVKKFIGEAKTLEELEKVVDHLDTETDPLYAEKKEALKQTKKEAK